MELVIDVKKGSLGELIWKDRYSYVKDVPFDERSLRCAGAKFQIVKFRPHSGIRPHYHKKTCEVFYVQGGRGLIGLNGKKFRCKPDDFFLCEPGDIHEFDNDTDGDFVILIFKTNEGENDIYWCEGGP